MYLENNITQSRSNYDGDIKEVEKYFEKCLSMVWKIYLYWLVS